MIAMNWMFDMNGDGKLEPWEEAMHFCFMDEMERKQKAAQMHTVEDDVFGLAGLDYEDLERMDPFDRRCLLENAGLNPDEFDF